MSTMVSTRVSAFAILRLMSIVSLSESTVLTLGDWYHGTAPSLAGVPTPNSTLINGKGRFLGGPAADLAVINVDRNRRYRFRLVSISCDPNFVFSIDGHVMVSNFLEIDRGH